MTLGGLGYPRQSRDWFQQAPPAPGGREGHQGDDLQKFRWFLLWLLQVAAIQGKPAVLKLSEHLRLPGLNGASNSRRYLEPGGLLASCLRHGRLCSFGRKIQETPRDRVSGEEENQRNKRGNCLEARYT